MTHVGRIRQTSHDFHSVIESCKSDRLMPRVLLASLLAILTSGCAASAGPAPAAGTTPLPPSVHRLHTAADVAFMQGMIHHHRQALEMTALVSDRTDTRTIRLLAERIEISQQDEIAQMAAWLERRGEAVPGEVAGHGGQGNGHDHHADHLSGMLTPEQMASLEAVRGAAFDRLFLELMIQHHLGALEMVDELMASPGAGQEVDVFRIAAEVDSDQRIEIERMERMLETIG